MNGLARIGPVWALAAGVAGALLAASCATTPQAVEAAEPESPAEVAIAQAKADAGTEPDAAPADSPATPAAPASSADPAPAPAASPAEPMSPGAPVEAVTEPGPPTQPSSTADAAATDDTRRGTWIVIEPGGEDPADVDIVAAARAERERRASAPPASRTITNKNLVKAEDGKAQAKAQAKTQAEKAPPAAVPADAPAKPPANAAAAEAYWRTRSYELRLAWKQAVDEIEDLERDADGLRRRFYAESDPYVRDTRVKPDWDRVLDRIREMRDLAERRREELQDHLEEGRQAGALPGWLREGIELEPAPRREEESRGPVEAVEPPEYPEPIGEPPPPPPLEPSR
jgi:hypothetical protein